MEEFSPLDRHLRLIFIGAENIVCPLGSNAEEVFDNANKGKTGIDFHRGQEMGEDGLFAARFHNRSSSTKESRFIEELILKSVKGSLEKSSSYLLKDPRTLFILSTTKGDIDLIEKDDDKARLSYLLDRTVKSLGFQGDNFVVSNACISGLLSVITARDLIDQDFYDHAIICGADLVSPFTVAGFQSFFAIDNKPCQPYDKERGGINLGEGSASLVVSKDASIFQNPLTYMGGACANDANHISGPSRTGEGLYRAITKSIKAASADPKMISQISAHGTATQYNDDMESIAFSRSGLGNVPVHSYKGYFGHTLGAAGLMELGLLFQTVRNDTVLASMGYKHAGTTESINVQSTTETLASSVVLKTASGFGGCNASALFGYEN
jgi:3-oxoacyl-[acyl-carrier-protein] synthase-1